MKEILKGSEVMYRPCFGMFAPKLVRIDYIQKSSYKRCKYGVLVDSVSFSDRDYCVFGLSDGHWCYGEQIDSVVS